MQPVEIAPKEVFLASLRRCTADPEFLKVFYERFIASSEEVKHKFRFTEMDKQRKMLERSLQVVAGVTDGDLEALRELNERADTHSHRKLDIHAGLYSHWMEQLLVTAKEFDPNWDSSTDSAWRITLIHVVSFMVRRY